jgi:hypothetical protein
LQSMAKHCGRSGNDWARGAWHLTTSTFLFFFFLQNWGLNSRPTPWATPLALFFCMCWVFWREGLLNNLPRLALNCDPPNFCLLGS